ncbi:hypothetical protein J6590_035338 [Homalodisca vitripennis]|nr:hypothetical protein J6590_035338 [Homalodisca vitripennis]
MLYLCFRFDFVDIAKSTWGRMGMKRMDAWKCKVCCKQDQIDFARGSDVHYYNTRRAQDYILPAHHATKYSKKPSYIG